MKPTPVTKEKLKLIKSLLLKKNRLEERAFLIEGLKSVSELLKSSLDISFLVSTQSCLDENPAIFNELRIPHFIAKVSDIERSGSLKTNNSSIAVVKIPDNKPVHASHDNFVIALENVRDPGNLGTIIRVADWYGIESIVLSNTCVDPYNPKTVAASMGSITRVQIFQTDLPDYLKKQKVETYAAVMDGQNIHDIKVNAPAIIVLGNESNGLSSEVLNEADQLISIPKFGKAESLNVAMATSIICDNLRRKKL